jgi:hypothetical protein
MVFTFGIALGIALGVVGTYFALHQEMKKANRRAYEYRTLWQESRHMVESIDWGSRTQENPLTTFEDLGL